MMYLIIFTHWIADFVCQTDDMAKNKSKSNYWLSTHIIAYMCVLWAFCCLLGIQRIANDVGLPPDFRYLKFTLVNGAVHFAIDYVTSRMSSKLWAKGEVHNFFVVIGFDQALHMATLYYTSAWLIA